MNIVTYKPAYQRYFQQLNKAWLTKYFKVEPIDEWVLTNPQEAILKDGGVILFAEHNDQIVGTVALKVVDPTTVEFTKMAVSEDFQGLGTGKLLCGAAIAHAKTMGAQRIILYSHSLLQPALSIYRKFGFVDIPVEKGVYERADVKMELLID